MSNTRYIAAKVINQVSNGQSLSDCLDNALAKIQDPRDRAFVQALCYGVCRFYSRLDVALSYLLKKPMNEKDSDVHALLLVGLYQLMEMHVQEHAAVSETVNATEKLKKPWARGLVNAILREYLRRHAEIKEELRADDEALYAHPGWWIKAIKKAWPEKWQEILTANNDHPPFSLRVNQLNLTREKYKESLAKYTEPTIGHVMNFIVETKSGITIEPAMPVDKLPGFAQGDVSVQDGAAQLATELLDLQPNQRVLDACAAPGGKLTHILEIEPNLNELIAIENNPSRVKSIEENLKRQKLTATVLCYNAQDVNAWWDGQPFDRILLDAPCSASGVIRRHPDIKLLRQPHDIANLAKLQLELLNALWPLLKPNGLLLYATCSIFPQENTDVLKAFLDAHPDAKEDEIKADWGVRATIGRQILPGMHGMDGFYYARVRKY